MSEQQKQDSFILATLLNDLSREDCLQVQGVIAGMKLARKTTTTDSLAQVSRELQKSAG